MAENAGYGFDKIEKNWNLHNNTQPEYEIDFDSVIVKMDSGEGYNEINDSISDGWVNIALSLSDLLESDPNNNIKTLQDIYRVFTG